MQAEDAAEECDLHAGNTGYDEARGSAAEAQGTVRTEDAAEKCNLHAGDTATTKHGR